MVRNDLISALSRFNRPIEVTNELEPFDLKDDNQPDLYKIVFAPDPLTGFPSSDLAFMLNKNQSEEVKQYVRNTLLNPRSDGNLRAPDADTAIEFTTPRFKQQFEEYRNKLTEFVNDLQKQKDDENK